jgi:hypothetical protein
MNQLNFSRFGPVFVLLVSLPLGALGACQSSDSTQTSAPSTHEALNKLAAPLSPLERARREDALGQTLEAAIHNLRGTLPELSKRGEASAIRAVEAKIGEFEAASAAHHSRAEALRRGG